MKAKYNYTAKKLFVFPLMAFIFIIMSLVILNYASNNHREWHTISSDILWATSNERPKEIKPEQTPFPSARVADADMSPEDVARCLYIAKSLGLPESVVLEVPEWAQQEKAARDVSRHPLLAKWVEEDRKQDVLKWDLINSNLSLVKKQQSYLLLKTIISAIAGLVTTLCGILFLYKSCRYSVPTAIKKIKQVVIKSATTPAKRIGILLLPLACFLFLCSILCWNDRWVNIFDTDYPHGILSFSGAMLFFVGIILASGAAERLFRWIKQGD